MNLEPDWFITPNDKKISVKNFPHWKYSLPKNSYFLEGMICYFTGAKTQIESAIEEVERKNKLLCDRINILLEKLVLEDNGYDVIFISFDNDIREVTFTFYRNTKPERIAYKFTIDYFCIIDRTDWFEYFVNYLEMAFHAMDYLIKNKNCAILSPTWKQR